MPAEKPPINSTKLHNLKTSFESNPESLDARGSSSFESYEPRRPLRTVTSNDTVISLDRSRLSRSTSNASNTITNGTTTPGSLSRSFDKSPKQTPSKQPRHTISQLLALPSIPENEDLEKTPPTDNEGFPRSFESVRLANFDGYEPGTDAMSTSAPNTSAAAAADIMSNANNFDAVSWSQIEDHNLHNGGLPTLKQVLAQKTQSPLSLRDFITHCTVRQPQARRWLEFYFSARAHKNMCKDYMVAVVQAAAAAAPETSGARTGTTQSNQYPPSSNQVTTSMDSGALPESMASSLSNQQYVEALAQIRQRQNSEDVSLSPISPHERTLRALNGQGVAEKRFSRNTKSSLMASSKDYRSSLLRSSNNNNSSHNNANINSIMRASTLDSADVVNLAAQVLDTKDLIISRYFRAALDPTVGGGAYTSTCGAEAGSGLGTNNPNSNNNNDNTVTSAAADLLLGNAGRYQGSFASPSPRSSYMVAPGFRGIISRPFSSASNKSNAGGFRNSRASDSSDIRKAEASARLRNITSADPLNSNSESPLAESPRALSMESQFPPSSSPHRPLSHGNGSSYLRQSMIHSMNQAMPPTDATNRHSYNTISNGRSSYGGVNHSQTGTSANLYNSPAGSNIIYHMVWPEYVLTNMSRRLQSEGAELDGSLFNAAITHAYQMLENLYFPVFLKEATSRNVTRPHGTFRVIIAYFILVFAFALPLSLILLDRHPKALRLWCLIPQILGWYNMAAGFSGCDILLVLLRRYQFPQYSPPLLFDPDPQSAQPNPTPSKQQIADNVDGMGGSKERHYNNNSKNSLMSAVLVTSLPRSHKRQSQANSTRNYKSAQEPQHRQASHSLAENRRPTWKQWMFVTMASDNKAATGQVFKRCLKWHAGALLMAILSTIILCLVPGTRLTH